MLDALKQLIGLQPRDRRENWHDQPVVLAGEEDEIAFAGVTTVVYLPGQESYEEGHLTLLDPSTGEPAFELEVKLKPVYSPYDQRGPYRTRFIRLGVKADGVDAEGREFKFYGGRNAYVYARNHALGVFTEDEAATFTNAEITYDAAELEAIDEELGHRKWDDDEE